VIGGSVVDTHKHAHHASVVGEQGCVLDNQAFVADDKRHAEPFARALHGRSSTGPQRLCRNIVRACRSDPDTMNR
jgi:hypothetical protein